jgi:hypothetical protein
MEGRSSMRYKTTVSNDDDLGRDKWGAGKPDGLIKHAGNGHWLEQVSKASGQVGAHGRGQSRGGSYEQAAIS